MRRLFALLALPALAGCGMWPAAEAPGALPLAEQEAAAGIREALAVAGGRAIARLGRQDGFWHDPRLRIPLPESLARAEKALRRLGKDRIVNDFHLSLNRAAERAVPEAAGLFAAAARELTLTDAHAVLAGGDEAASAYFRGRTETALAAQLRPIVAQVTGASGVTRRYKNFTAKASRLVGTDPGALDLDAYITERALAGLFVALAEEEQRIRRDPAARGSELLRRVFGAR